jgi:peroxiredoxin (alkyl hydroperoxide reductase subunit C)
VSAVGIPRLQAGEDVKYPLLADFTNQVSKDYGVLLERLGAALRGTFIIDPDGLVRAYIVQDLTVGRTAQDRQALIGEGTGSFRPAY